MSPPDKTAYLSKSLYTRGLQCYKSLYLHSNYSGSHHPIPPV